MYPLMQIQGLSPLAQLVQESRESPQTLQFLTVVFKNAVDRNIDLAPGVTARRTWDGTYTVLTDYRGLCLLLNPITLQVKHPNIVSIGSEAHNLEPLCPLGTPLPRVERRPVDRIETVHVNGVDLECRIAGFRDKPLVILLHGFPDTHHCFDAQIEELMEDFYLVAPNLRGYGGSTKPISGYDLQNLAKDISKLISHFGRRAQLVGHDWGGSIAWAVAHLHPDKVTNLIVMNAPHPATFRKHVFSSLQLFSSWYIFMFQIPYASESLLAVGGGLGIGALIRLWAHKPLRPEVVEAMKREMLKPDVLAAALQYYRTALRTSPPPSLFEGKLEIPVHILWGERDHCLRASVLQGVADFARNLDYKFLPGVGHWVTREAPDDVTRQLKEWLN